MTQITLKKLLNPRKPTCTIVVDLLENLGTPMNIQNTDGLLLLGKTLMFEMPKTAVHHEETLAGWVQGPDLQAGIVARLLE
ncbi:MAG: hypothetical protein GWP61_23215, partial [Chloroflexi bacterium]|nr:hypothetical protein [Chloroflexota bacterium]